MAGLDAGAGSDAPAAVAAAAVPIPCIDEQSTEEVVAWLNSVDAFIFDCDGVLWRGGTRVPDAGSVVDGLRAIGKKVLFVTNNSTKTRKQNVSKFAGLGIEAVETDLYATAYCTAAYLKRTGMNKKKVYAVGHAGLKAELEAVGYEVLGLEHSGGTYNLGDLRREDFEDEEMGAVVVGYDLSYNYLKMAYACGYLRCNPGCLFVRTNPDTTFPDTNTLLPGGGCMSAGIAAAVGREPDVTVGKPTRHMLDQVQADFHLDLAKTVMVGDRLNTDIAFGNAGCGHSLLVLTGVTEVEELSKITKPEEIPKFYAKSVASLLEAINTIKAAKAEAKA